MYPANYSEQWMNAHETELQGSTDIRTLEIPYGVENRSVHKGRRMALWYNFERRSESYVERI